MPTSPPPAIAVVSVVGTRPEAIKMAPVARALARRPGVEHQVILTGQHAGLAGYFDHPRQSVLQLRFSPRGRTPEGLREALRAMLCGRFRRGPVDLVLVHGDTTSAVAGALAAQDCGIPTGHVEAGLRSHDLAQPFPEEGHRVAIDALAELLFAPTDTAADNLRREGRVSGRIWVTGNTGIDALLQARTRIASPVRPARSGGRRLILATCHRRENQGEPVRSVCEALKRMVRELPVRVAAPLHPNPLARRGVEHALAGAEHIELLEPLDHDGMVRLMASSWLILTDSGGLQEEAPALGKPVLVLREVTERPEALATGSLELVGTDPDRIVAAVSGLLADPARYARMARTAFPFGDGHAAERIAEAIEAWRTDARPRPA
ncbi:MAG TPA: UDP-N-acetylglucosamine 2-epimerase (non-hydrolyzing) [Allosphingosinicella sp.]|nr:UDP-N-acetylglucosamine 2-epimerase (non-hydrolyzing) [Allosphingosinicella sp.]